MNKALVLLSMLTGAAAQGTAAQEEPAKTGRACPLALAGYAVDDGAVTVEFNGDEARTFSILVEGLDGAFDGFVFPGDDDTEELAVVLDNCPEGDVTGADLDACRIWQGQVSGVDMDGGAIALPGPSSAASPGLRLQGFADALSGSPAFAEAGLAPVSFDHLALFACQE